MALIVIRPSVVAGNNGWVFVNGNNANTIVADGSDASSLYNSSSQRITFTFPALSAVIPFGARVLNVQLGLRTWATDVVAQYADEGFRGTNGYAWARPTITFETAEGGAIQTYNALLSTIPTSWDSAVVAWPANWTDLATAPEISFDAHYVATGLVNAQTFNSSSCVMGIYSWR
jgi:hypothetical protein